MEANTSDLGVPTNVGQNNKEEQLRRIPPSKITQLKRAMDGAEQRMLRLKTELLECRAIIRRKYVERQESKGSGSTQVQLNPAQVEGYRLKRTEIEGQLAIASGDYLQSKRAYRKAVEQNIQVVRKSVRMVREENRVRREANKLLNQTKAALEKHGKSGGAEEMKRLQDLALADDVREFRKSFDELLHRLDPAHHEVISGVSQVKTEIVHAIMEQLAEDARKHQDVGQPEGGAQ